MGQRSPAVPARVERLHQRFERWRRTRERRGRIPEDLWSAAANLAQVYGVSGIAQALRLDYYSLKERVEAAADGSEDRAAFVEVPADDVVAVETCQVELISGDGARMTIRGCSASDLDVKVLVTTFLGRRR